MNKIIKNPVIRLTDLSIFKLKYTTDHSYFILDNSFCLIRIDKELVSNLFYKKKIITSMKFNLNSNIENLISITVEGIGEIKSFNKKDISYKKQIDNKLPHIIYIKDFSDLSTRDWGRDKNLPFETLQCYRICSHRNKYIQTTMDKATHIALLDLKNHIKIIKKSRITY